MDDLKALNLLVQSGSFGVLVLLVIWVMRFIPKRIEKADQLRELEAEAKKQAAESLRLALVEQERGQTERVNKLIEAHAKDIERVLATHAEQLRYERETCQKQHVELQTLLQDIRTEATEDRQRQYEILRNIDHAMRDNQQIRANERAEKKIREQQEKQEKRAPGSS